MNSCRSLIANSSSTNTNSVPTTLSDKSKNPRGLVPSTQPLQVGDIVYLVSDKDKSCARDHYIVMSVDPHWCFVKKFSGSQLRAIFYKVKLSECYAIPPSVVVSNHPGPPPPEDKDDPPTQDKDNKPPPLTTSVPQFTQGRPLLLRLSSLLFRPLRSTPPPSPVMSLHLMSPFPRLLCPLYKRSVTPV